MPRKLGERTSFFVLFVPWFILFFLFTFFIAGYNVFLSFTDWRGIFPSFNFAGLDAWRRLFRMRGFWETTANVGLLYLVGLPSTLAAAIVLAVLMDSLRGIAAHIVRGVAVSTMALGGVTVSTFWSMMYNYRYGGINQLLRQVGLDFLAIEWIGRSQFVMYAVILMLFWTFLGYAAMVILGGLQGVPQSQLEAARIEGASTIRVYRSVLIPQVFGHILTITLLLSMFYLKAFDNVYVLTGGGPGWSSAVFPILVYRKMFGELDYAGGAAAATFLFIIVSVIAIPYLIYSRRVERGGGVV